jgi:hypothetical protein
MARTPGANRRAEAQNIRVFNRDGWKCVYCGWDGNSETTFVFLELDHLDPTTKTLDDFDPEFDHEKVTACIFCNRKKCSFKPSGASIEEKLADAIRYVHSLRTATNDWFRKNHCIG